MKRHQIELAEPIIHVNPNWAKTRPTEYFYEIGSSSLQPREKVARIVQEIKDILSSGEAVTARNFVTGRIDLELEGLAEALLREGIFQWNLRVVFVDSTLEALHHSKSEVEKDQLMQAIYVVRSKDDIARYNENRLQLARGSSQSAGETITRYFSHAKFYYFDYGTPQLVQTGRSDIYARIQDGREPLPEPKMFAIPMEKAIALFEPKTMKWITDDRLIGPFIVQPGFARPLIRGVVDVDRTLTANAYKEAARLASRKGLTVTFTKSPEESLIMARDQWRLVSTPEGSESWAGPLAPVPQGLKKAPTNQAWAQVSRYRTSQALYNSTLKALHEGRAFTVEVRDQSMNLLGGLLGNYGEHGVFEIDTVFYDNLKYPELGIDIAKIALVAFKDRLQDAKIEWWDMGMTSSYTRSMLGYLVTDVEFLQRMKNAAVRFPNGANVDLSTPWDPKLRSHDEGRASDELARLTNAAKSAAKAPRPQLSPEEIDARKKAAIAQRQIQASKQTAGPNGGIKPSAEK